MFKNMKIAINDQQPLDEVVRELERIGYVKGFCTERPKSVETYSNGTFDSYWFSQDSDVNLMELRSMSTELKEME